VIDLGRRGRLVRRHKNVGGFILVELEDVPWDTWLRQRGDVVILCGELGHAEWCLYQIAWKHTVEKIFAATPPELARRVGVELPSTHTSEHQRDSGEPAS
jgi:hypothetical protein